MRHEPSTDMIMFQAVLLWIVSWWPVEVAEGEPMFIAVGTLCAFCAMLLAIMSVKQSVPHPSPFPSITGQIAWALRPRKWMVAWGLIIALFAILGRPMVLNWYGAGAASTSTGGCACTCCRRRATARSRAAGSSRGGDDQQVRTNHVRHVAGRSTAKTDLARPCDPTLKMRGWSCRRVISPYIIAIDRRRHRLAARKDYTASGPYFGTPSKSAALRRLTSQLNA
jgi:hypothetical protein